MSSESHSAFPDHEVATIKSLGDQYPPNNFHNMWLLISHGVKVADIATAIEKVGFYTWDRYGRFMHIKPSLDGSPCSPKCEEILEKLAFLHEKNIAARRKVGEQGRELLRETGHDLFWAGWRKGELPDFASLRREWHQAHAGTDDVPDQPRRSEPASQSKSYDVVKGLLMLKYGDDVIDDLTRSRSMKAKPICDALASKEIKVSPKKLKEYVNLSSQ